LQDETSITKECEVKESTDDGGSAAKPIDTPVTTNTYNTQATKYYKGRQAQPQPRTMRDGNYNNNFNR